MLTFIIVLLLTGLIVGALARLALPGPDPMSIFATIGIGIAGSFIAGVIVYAISGRNTGAGFVLSVVCSAGLVYLVRRSRGQGLGSTRRPPGANPTRF
jgi:uncharacterized membrane protein YeaQ/YmgE (transglycosylase-associated protein family)